MRYIDTTALLARRAAWGNRQELWRNPTLNRDFKAFFHGKCWYSEADLAGQDAHIDHFRPKAQIVPYEHYDFNVPLKDVGYYWLKNDVTNYRACCVFSNRITRDGGKGNFFPLQPGSPRLTPNGNEAEKPLLLDPCNQSDVKLISFCGKDIICASARSGDDSRVEASKVIYNLIDPFITDRRSKVWEDVSKTIAEYEAQEISLTACVRRLSSAVSRETPYSACAIACVNSLAPDDIKAQLDLRL